MIESTQKLAAVKLEQQFVTGEYELVAPEYYDAMRHPTCANFRRASDRIISRWLTRADQRIVDVGCGHSIVAEIMRRNGWHLQLVTLVDSSPTMLGYSFPFAADGAQLVLSCAEEFKLLDESPDVVVASLGDPFNTDVFWRHVRHTLRPAGQVVFTTPSFEWSSRFRDGMNHPPDAAEFLTATGARVFLPSFVLPEEQQILAFERAGMRVLSIEHVTVAELGAVRVSSKLYDVRDGEPVVTGYLCSADLSPR